MLATAHADTNHVMKGLSRAGVRACVADPSPLIRQLAAMQLKSLGAVEVVECATPAQTRKALRTMVPDLLVIEASWLEADIRILAKAGALAVAATCERGELGLKKPFAGEALRAHIRAAMARR